MYRIYLNALIYQSHKTGYSRTLAFFRQLCQLVPLEKAFRLRHITSVSKIGVYCVMKRKNNRKNNTLPRDIVLQDLRSRVENSLPGTRLPSENALALKYNTARMTVTRAFRQLELEGLIERRKGCGSFVKGMRTVAFFLPYPEFITEQGDMAEIFRARLHGAIRASQDLRLKLNIFPLLNTRNSFYSPKVFQDFSPASLVITSTMMPDSFQYLFEHKVRTVLFCDDDIPHGIKQYTYDWIKVEKDHSSAFSSAIAKLRAAGCHKIASVSLGKSCGVPLLTQGLPVEDTCDIVFVSEKDAPYTINSVGKQQEFLGALWREHDFDGLLFNTPLSVSGKSINEYCGLPDRVKIIGMNIFPERCSLETPFASCTARDDIMGYDAVKALTEAPRMGVKKRYEYNFYDMI